MRPAYLSCVLVGGLALFLSVHTGSTRSTQFASLFALFAGFVVGAEILRHRLERGIELHKRVLDRGVQVVAGPAAVALRHGLGGLGIRFKAVVGPFVGISGGVFDF